MRRKKVWQVQIRQSSYSMHNPFGCAESIENFLTKKQANEYIEKMQKQLPRDTYITKAFAAYVRIMT